MTLSRSRNQPLALSPPLLAVAWAVTLFISHLPDILLRELGGGSPGWLVWSKALLLVVLLAASLSWQAIRPLRDYLTILLVDSLPLGSC